MLNVSGPFHSGMLADAGEKLGEVLSQVELHEPQIPYVANVTAQYVKSAAEVKELLTRQVHPRSDGSRAWKHDCGRRGHLHRDWTR